MNYSIVRTCGLAGSSSSACVTVSNRFVRDVISLPPPILIKHGDQRVNDMMHIFESKSDNMRLFVFAGELGGFYIKHCLI